MKLSELNAGDVFTIPTSSSASSYLRYNGHTSNIQYVLSSPVELGLEITYLNGKSSSVSYYLSPDSEVDRVDTGKLKLLGGLPSRSNILTSADPEFFLRDEKGELVPGYSVLPNKKGPGRVSCGVFHEDGFQAELSPEPDSCHERVVRKLGLMMNTVERAAVGGDYQEMDRSYIPDNIFTGAYTTRIVPEIVVEIPPPLLKTAPAKFVSLGCDPSENIYGTPSFSVDNPRAFPFRMAGGHIHLGTPTIASFLHSHADQIIASMDAFLGVGAVALFDKVDDPRRRQYYGRAGEFRYQKHGLEYRSLSNVWTWHPAIAHLILNLARGSFRFGMYQFAGYKVDQGAVQEIINTHDVKGAQAFIRKHRSVFAHILRCDSQKGWSTTAVELIGKGVLAAFPDYHNIHKNWRRSHASFASKSKAVKKRLAEIAPEKTVKVPSVVRPRDAYGRFIAA
jgi:hypothetical protein